MRLYAIGDLHLSKSGNKPMDIFGSAWKDHERKISDAWSRTVTDEDIVLIPGDLSWAMRLDEAYIDLYNIMQLPGQKIIIKGNHDYWWSSISRVRQKFSEFKNTHFLQNDAVSVCGISFAGVRGWVCPQCTEYKASKDEVHYKRELLRLSMSLSCMEQALPKVVLIHYPPYVTSENEITQMLEANNVNNVVYGHLHGIAIQSAVSGIMNGIQYDLCSADAVNFRPAQIVINTDAISK